MVPHERSWIHKKLLGSNQWKTDCTMVHPAHMGSCAATTENWKIRSHEMHGRKWSHILQNWRRNNKQITFDIKKCLSQFQSFLNYNKYFYPMLVISTLLWQRWNESRNLLKMRQLVSNCSRRDSQFSVFSLSAPSKELKETIFHLKCASKCHTLVIFAETELNLGMRNPITA